MLMKLGDLQVDSFELGIICVLNTSAIMSIQHCLYYNMATV